MLHVHLDDDGIILVVNEITELSENPKEPDGTKEAFPLQQESEDESTKIASVESVNNFTIWIWLW